MGLEGYGAGIETAARGCAAAGVAAGRLREHPGGMTQGEQAGKRADGGRGPWWPAWLGMAGRESRLGGLGCCGKVAEADARAGPAGCGRIRLAGLHQRWRARKLRNQAGGSAVGSGLRPSRGSGPGPDLTEAGGGEARAGRPREQERKRVKGVVWFALLWVGCVCGVS